MGTLLAVDTSSGRGSLALLRDDGNCQSVELPEEWKSTTLHGELAGLLERNGLRAADLKGYAVAAGPGPFTGLRVGLTAVKALAEAHDKPIISISTLELAARAARQQAAAAHCGLMAPLLDARRNQVFAALYEGLEMRPLIAECVGSLTSFLERVRAIAAGGVCFCATEPELFAPQIVQAGWKESALLRVPANLSPVLAELGMERLQEGRGISAAQADANYVRASDAELFWKE